MSKCSRCGGPWTGFGLYCNVCKQTEVLEDQEKRREREERYAKKEREREDRYRRQEEDRRHQENLASNQQILAIEQERLEVERRRLQLLKEQDISPEEAYQKAHQSINFVSIVWNGESLSDGGIPGWPDYQSPYETDSLNTEYLRAYDEILVRELNALEQSLDDLLEKKVRELAERVSETLTQNLDVYKANMQVSDVRRSITAMGHFDVQHFNTLVQTESLRVMWPLNEHAFLGAGYPPNFGTSNNYLILDCGNITINSDFELTYLHKASSYVRARTIFLDICKAVVPAIQRKKAQLEEERNQLKTKNLLKKAMYIGVAILILFWMFGGK